MQDEGTTRTTKPLTRWGAAVAGLAAAIAISGAMLAFSSVAADASPNKVTKDKPCGSCHPPNKPPTRK